MSHSGNNPSRRLRNLQKLQAIKEGEQFYNPSVFRYKCYGYLQLNSEDKGSSGTCRGFQSRMERVANMVPDTREGAIKKFLDASADLGTYVDAEDSSDQKVKEIYTARTMIYKEGKPWEDSNVAKIQPVKSSPFPEEELINKTEWSCWGSTSVHYLVLEPIATANKVAKKAANTAVQGEDNSETKSEADTMFAHLTQQLRKSTKDFDKSFEKNKNAEGEDNDKEEDGGKKKRRTAREVSQGMAKKQDAQQSKDSKVSAITPENIGMSIRKIDSSVGHFTVTDIGSIRICVESSASLIGDSSSTRNNSTATDEEKSQQNDQGQPQTGGEIEEKKKPYDLKKFYEFSVKVGHQMQYNCKEIREAVRDDFPGRTYRFGTKVANRFHQTSEQTFTYMGKILNSWWKSM